MTSAIKEPSILLANGRGIRPPLKWAGGKRWLVPHIEELFETYSKKVNRHKSAKLVEPFCGGLAVTLGLQPERALLNDINPHSMNFYNWLSRGLIVKMEMYNDEQYYYQCREKFNMLLENGAEKSRAAAELFYYLNRTGYNGLCRFNRKGLFNVPFGRYKKINYTTDFRPYKSIFKDWHFLHGDFELIPVHRDDFLYADPPYDVEFRQYSKEGFTWEDQQRLASWLDKHNGPVIASNQATDRIIKLYKSLGFNIEVLEAPRMISCTGDRSKAKEMLAYKGI